MYFLGFTWNPADTLFKIGVLQIKYYNLLWITAFALGWYIMKKIFVKENKSIEQLDSLFIYTVLATMLGASQNSSFLGAVLKAPMSPATKSTKIIIKVNSTRFT